LRLATYTSANRYTFYQKYVNIGQDGVQITENGSLMPDGSKVHDNGVMGIITFKINYEEGLETWINYGAVTLIPISIGLPFWHISTFSWSGQLQPYVDWVVEKWNEYGQIILDGIQLGLTIASIVLPPGLGMVASLVNLGIDYARGKEITALDVGLALLPGAGAIARGAGAATKLLGGSCRMVTNIQRATQVGANGYFAYAGITGGYQAGKQAIEDFKQGNYLKAARGAIEGVRGVVGGAKAGLSSAKALSGRYDLVTGRRLKAGEKLSVACFAAGTPLLTPNGSKLINEIQVGDVVLSRDEYNADGEVEGKVVEEVFVNYSKLIWLTVKGRRIGTTTQHPFYVVGRNEWVSAGELEIGDEFVGSNGEIVKVDGKESGEWETVYNLRVADYHTYFVGGEEWGFSVWSHNSCDGKTLGNLGEAKVRSYLISKGLQYLGQIQNASGHGIDLAFRTKSGALVFVEVKSSSGNVAPSLSKYQRNSEKFVGKRLKAAETAGDNKGHWKNVDSATRSLAKNLRAEIKGGAKVKYLRAKVTNLFSGDNASVMSFQQW
jgi:Holliday junction resolvase-like predicted endonuclease